MLLKVGSSRASDLSAKCCILTVYDYQSNVSDVDTSRSLGVDNKAEPEKLAPSLSEILQPFSLLRFKPLNAPFIPKMLTALVNHIESKCHQHNALQRVFGTSQKDIFKDPESCGKLSLTSQTEKDMKLLLSLSSVDRYADECVFRKVLADASPRQCVRLIRLFFRFLRPKLLVFSRGILRKMRRYPLFNQFIQANPYYAVLIKEALMRIPRTSQDSLAFVMLHVIHMWEYASEPYTWKVRLSQLYGPLLMGFDEKVILRGNAAAWKTENRTPESSLMEVMLDIFDKHFWNILSCNTVQSAFGTLSLFEAKLSQRFTREETTGSYESGCSGEYIDMQVGSVEEVESDEDNQSARKKYWLRLGAIPQTDSGVARQGVR